MLFMNSENKENESYGEVCDKITRVVKYMTERDGKEPGFQEFFVEIVKSRDLPTYNFEFIIPRYAEVWKDIIGYTDDHKFLLDGLKSSNKKESIKKRKPLLRTIKNLIKKMKLTARYDKAIINNILLQIILFILICFYYEWITNIGNHVDLFFDAEADSFLRLLAIVFWLVTCISSGLFLGFKTVKGLSKINNFLKKIRLSYRDIEDCLISIFNNKTGKLMLGLFVIFFLFFSSSSKYYNNYYGLTLKFDDEEFVDMVEYYDYVEEEYSFEAAESLDFYNNDLFSNQENKSSDLMLIEHLFSKEEFIFKETGAFQGYSTYSLKEGFLPYLKCLFISFLETTYRAILFFLIIGTPLLLLVLKCSDKQQKIAASIFFGILFLWFIYILGNELFMWIKSFFN